MILNYLSVFFFYALSTYLYVYTNIYALIQVYIYIQVNNILSQSYRWIFHRIIKRNSVSIRALWLAIIFTRLTFFEIVSGNITRNDQFKLEYKLLCYVQYTRCIILACNLLMCIYITKTKRKEGRNKNWIYINFYPTLAIQSKQKYQILIRHTKNHCDNDDDDDNWSGIDHEFFPFVHSFYFIKTFLLSTLFPLMFLFFFSPLPNLFYSFSHLPLHYPAILFFLFILFFIYF